MLEEDVSVGELTRPRLHTHAWGSRELIARGPCAVARPWDCAAARLEVPSAARRSAAQRVAADSADGVGSAFGHHHAASGSSGPPPLPPRLA